MNHALLKSIRDSWRQAANPHTPASIDQLVLLLDALLTPSDDDPYDDSPTWWPRGTDLECQRCGFVLHDIAAKTMQDVVNHEATHTAGDRLANWSA